MKFRRLTGSLLAVLFVIAGCSDSEKQPEFDLTGCDNVGFEPVTKMAFWDHPWYDFILMSGQSIEEPVTYLDLQFYKKAGSQPAIGKTGKLAVDIDPNDCGTCVIISTKCVEGICEELYFAGEGEINITSWGAAKGETFSGSLNNAVFYQIEPDGMYYKYKDNGKIWCVPNYEFSTEIQSVHDYSN